MALKSSSSKDPARIRGFFILRQGLPTLYILALLCNFLEENLRNITSDLIPSPLIREMLIKGCL